MELRNFRRRRHLYSAGRPSRWASAHILVLLIFALKLILNTVTNFEKKNNNNPIVINMYTILIHHTVINSEAVQKFRDKLLIV